MSMNTFGERLRWARKLRGLTQEQLAVQSGVPQGTISKAEREKQLSSKSTPQLAKALRVNAMWLATGDPDLAPKETAAMTALANPIEDTVRFKLLTATLGMGPGVPAEINHDEQVCEIETTRQWVNARLSKATSMANIRIVTGLGDSMKPTIGDGDAVFVDTGTTRADVDAVYALEHNGELFLKRVQRLPGGRIKLISDNRSVYDPVVVEFKDVPEFRVIGRVIGAMNFNEM